MRPAFLFPIISDKSSIKKQNTFSISISQMNAGKPCKGRFLPFIKLANPAYAKKEVRFIMEFFL
jgi:hypothetical protein